MLKMSEHEGPLGAKQAWEAERGKGWQSRPWARTLSADPQLGLELRPVPLLLFWDKRRAAEKAKG